MGVCEGWGCLEEGDDAIGVIVQAGEEELGAPRVGDRMWKMGSGGSKVNVFVK
jgi:hypothetical protein